MLELVVKMNALVYFHASTARLLQYLENAKKTKCIVRITKILCLIEKASVCGSCDRNVYGMG